MESSLFGVAVMVICVSEYPVEALYEVVRAAKDGYSVAPVSTRELSSAASAESAVVPAFQDDQGPLPAAFIARTCTLYWVPTSSRTCTLYWVPTSRPVIVVR